jgi:hypothetical protein
MAEKESDTWKLIRSYAKGFVKGNTTDTLGAPVDLINEAIIRPAANILGLGDKVSDKPVGGSKYLREKFGQAAEDENLAETVGSLVSPGGIADLAIILPAFLTKSLATVRAATNAKKKGATDEDLLGEFGVFASPNYAADGVMRDYLPDTAAKLRYQTDSNPSGLNIEQNIWQQDRGPAAFIRGPYMSFKSPSTLPDVLDHSDLFKLVPDLDQTKIQNALFTSIDSAWYRQDTDTIGLGGAYKPENMLDALLHETQHAIQGRFGMVGGGNSGMFMEDKARVDKALSTLYSAEARLKKNASPELKESIRNSRRELEAINSGAFARYRSLGGEAEAFGTEALRRGQTNNVLDIYNTPIGDQFTITDPAQASKLDDDPVIQAILSFAENQQKVLEARKILSGK